MREIKFRAWNEGICRMFSPEELGEDELTINPDGRGFVNVNSTDPKLSEYYQHMIPMQYTGFKDINGKEIYEGDIVKCNDIYFEIEDAHKDFIVSWIDDGWAIINNNEYICGLWDYVHNHKAEIICELWKYVNNKDEVIGNNYDEIINNNRI